MPRDSLVKRPNHYLQLGGQAAVTLRYLVSQMRQKQACSSTKGGFQWEENGGTATEPASTLLCFMSPHKHLCWLKINH